MTLQRYFDPKRLGNTLVVCGCLALSPTVSYAAQACHPYPVGPQPHPNPGSGMPPYPPGHTSYNCTPRSLYDQTGPWQSTPQSPYHKPDQEIANVTLKADAGIQANAKKIFNVDVKIGGNFVTVLTRHPVLYESVQYTNHFRCNGAGNGFIYLNKDRVVQYGHYETTDPLWAMLADGYLPGVVIWDPKSDPLSINY